MVLFFEKTKTTTTNKQKQNKKTATLKYGPTFLQILVKSIAFEFAFP